MLKAIEQIDIAGRGVMDVFNEYLPVTYIEKEISVPILYAGSNHEAYFDFDVPPEITGSPFFWLVDPNYLSQVALIYRYYTFYTPLGNNRWRLTIWGVGWKYKYDNGWGGWGPSYDKPIIGNGVTLIIGGYRG